MPKAQPKRKGGKSGELLFASCCTRWGFASAHALQSIRKELTPCNRARWARSDALFSLPLPFPRVPRSAVGVELR